MAPSYSDPDRVTVKNYFGKVMQTGFAFGSLLSFADCEISGTEAVQKQPFSKHEHSKYQYN